MQQRQLIGFCRYNITYGSQFSLSRHLLRMAFCNPSASNYGKIQIHIKQYSKKILKTPLKNQYFYVLLQPI
jgi:hypothetical protein